MSATRSHFRETKQEHIFHLRPAFLIPHAYPQSRSLFCFIKITFRKHPLFHIPSFPFLFTTTLSCPFSLSTLLHPKIHLRILQDNLQHAMDKDRDKDKDKDGDDKSRRKGKSSRDAKGRSSSSRDRPNVKKHQISYLLNSGQSQGQASNQARNDPTLDTLSLRDLRQHKHKQSRKTNEPQPHAAPAAASQHHRNDPMLNTQSLRDLRLYKQKQSRKPPPVPSSKVKTERSHASSSTKPHLYRCVQCKKDFYTKFDYDEHIMRFHTPRIHKCDLCDASFGEKGNLNRHVNENDRPWPCNECGLAFGFRDTLNRHIDAVHRGLRPFPCSGCHARFKKRAHLQRHEKTCTGEIKDAAGSSKRG